MSWVAAAIGVVGAGVSIYKGIKQKSDAKNQLNALNGQEIPAEALQNQKLAQNLANQGLPSEQYAMARKNIDRQNSFAITQAGSRRAGLGLIPYIQQNTNDAYGKLDAANAAMRVSNTGKLMAANDRIANFQNQKYQGDYNYARSLQGAGNQNINNGIDSGLSAVGGAFGKKRSNSSGLYGGGSYGSSSYFGTADGGE